MKQLSLLLIATLAVWGLNSCDNAKLGAMKAEQERMVDSLANVQIEELKAQLMEDCDASVEEIIQMKVDSVQAAMTSSGGSGKTNTGTSKPTKPKPDAVTPNTGGNRDLKDRRRGNSSSPDVMTNPDGSKATPNTGGNRSLKDRRRGGGN